MTAQIKGLCSGLQECLYAVQSRLTGQPYLNPHSSEKCMIKGEIILDHSPGQSGPGKSASVQVYSYTEIDPSKFSFHLSVLNVI